MSHPLYVPFLVVAILGLGAVLLIARGSRGLKARRERFIRGYAFPAIVRERILRLHPEWSRQDLEHALRALRDFFLLCLAARGTIVQMTSKPADDAWHEFIVCTRDYDAFCRRAFGRYLHHKPDPVAMAAGAEVSCGAGAGGGYFLGAGATDTGHHGHHGCSAGHGHGCSSSGCSGSCGGGGCSSS
jgi:uncharacterized membrane protein YgcG